MPMSVLLSVALFSPPILFNSDRMAWLMNPMIGYDVSEFKLFVEKNLLAKFKIVQ